MKVLNSIEPTYPSIINRIIIINLCKEAMSIGVKLRGIPTTVSAANKIVSSMLDILCPGMEKQVQNCTINSVARHRTVIQDTHATLCPWAVQILPIKGCDISISRLIRSTLMWKVSSDYEMYVIGGTVGAFAEANGFSLMYRTKRDGETRFFIGSSIRSKMKEIESIYQANDQRIKQLSDDELDITKSNMASPLAFCRCIRMIYKEIIDHIFTINSLKEHTDNVRKKMLLVAREKKPKVKLATKVEPIATPVTTSNHVTYKMIVRNGRREIVPVGAT